MKEAKKTRFRIFLWDQFILPFYLLLNLYQLQALLIALIISNFVVWKNVTFFWVLVLSLGIIFIYQIIKYYKSGEFMHNYRKYKSERGEYKDYRKVAKILKKEKESNNKSKDKSITWTPGPIKMKLKDVEKLLGKEEKELNQETPEEFNELNKPDAFHE